MKEAATQGFLTISTISWKFNKAQKRRIETCIDSILEGNGVCQTYLYEEEVKDGSRLMKMIHDM